MFEVQNDCIQSNNKGTKIMSLRQLEETVVNDGTHSSDS